MSSSTVSQHEPFAALRQIYLHFHKHWLPGSYLQVQRLLPHKLVKQSTVARSSPRQILCAFEGNGFKLLTPLSWNHISQYSYWIQRKTHKSSGEFNSWYTWWPRGAQLFTGSHRSLLSSVPTLACLNSWPHWSGMANLPCPSLPAFFSDSTPAAGYTWSPRIPL